MGILRSLKIEVKIPSKIWFIKNKYILLQSNWVFPLNLFYLLIMIHQGLYADRTALFQLFILLLFILLGAVFSSFIGMGIFFLFYGMDAEISNYPNMMRLLQFISAIGTFLLPSLGLAWLCGHRIKEYLSIGKSPKIPLLVYTFFSMLLLSPTINLLGLLNQQMVLPDFLAPIENWMRVQEETAEKLTEIMLSGDGFFVLLINLIVIAVTAGITEEFLFRGSLQRIIGRWTSNHHIIIWTAAFLFSAFHMQFFGFIPRLLLGAYFGYLLYWGKNIWIPIFAHFTNNAVAVIGMSDNRLKENEYITGDIPAQELLPYSILAIVTLIAFCWVAIRLKEQLNEKHTL